MSRTPEQQRAITATGGDICVAAGAGSGKTRVLTERYVWLLTERRMRAEQVVTITFTDAAAAEMRDRIARLLLDRGQVRLLRDVEAGYISTIHAFCLRMLREYALDADIDPNARVLSEIEAARYRVGRREEMLAEYSEYLQPVVDRYRTVETFHAVFELIEHGRKQGLKPHELVERYAKDESAWRDLLDRRCAEQALRLQQWLIDQVIRLDEYAVPPGTRADDAVRQAVAFAKDLPRDRLLPVHVIREQLRDTIKGWTADSDSPLEKARKRLLNGTLPSAAMWRWFEPDFAHDLAFARDREAVLQVAALEWERYQQWKSETGQVDFLDMLTAARDLFESHRERFLDRFRCVLVDEFQDTNPLQTRIIHLLTRHRDEDDDGGNGDDADGTDDADAGDPDRREVFVVGDARQSIYRFRQADVTVFREFEQRAREGKDGSQRLTLSANFRSVPPILDFVNEFFADLWSARDTDLAADPLRAGRDLDAEQQAAGDGSGVPTTLSDPRVELLLYDPEDVARQLDKPARDTSRDRRGSYGRNKPDPSAATAEECVAREAEQIARRLRHLVEHEQPRFFDPDLGRWRRVRYHDIALLLFARTHLAVFEMVFQSHNLPFLSLGGREFFNRREVVDLTNALAVTVNPLLDIPLASLWRSPLVGLTDDTLFWIAHALGDDDDGRDNDPGADEADGGAPKPVRGARRKRRPLIGILDVEPDDLPAAVTDEQRERFGRFRDSFHRIMQRRDTASCSDLVEEWIRETDLRTRLQVSDGATQATANIDKLVELAATFDSDGRQPLVAFVESLLECRRAEVQEADAPPNPEPGERTPDSIRIMTVHAAKGLEFPVVVVPHLGREMTWMGGISDEQGRFMRNPWRTSDEFGAVARLIEDAGNWEGEDTFALELERIARTDADRDEYKRILYVACTRARELLLLAGGCDHAEPPPAWDEAKAPAQWVRRFAEQAGPYRAATSERLPDPYVDQQVRGATVRCWREVPPVDDEREARELANYVGHDLRAGRPFRWPTDLLGPPATEFRARVSAHAAQVLIAPEPAVQGPAEVAATALASYMLCPLRYWRSHVLALDTHLPGPDDRDRAATRDTEADDADDGSTPPDGQMDPARTSETPRAIARDLGTLVHRVLEALDLGRLLPGLNTDEHPRDVIRAAASRVGMPDDWLEEAINLTEAAFVGPFAATLRRATNVGQEVPFTLDLGTGCVAGVIDLLAVPPADRGPDSQREALVVDFKTNRIDSDADLAVAMAVYRHQLALYALAAAGRFGVSRVRAGLLFLRHRRYEELVFDERDLQAAHEQASRALDNLSRDRYAAPRAPLCAACTAVGATTCQAASSG